jgi:hypothetical protein
MFQIMAIHQWSKNSNVTNDGFGQSARIFATKFSKHGIICNLKEGGICPRFGWHLELHRCGSEDNRLVISFIICTFYQI